METRTHEIFSKKDPAISIGIIPGHFATNHSHVNYYVDMTSIKCNLNMAKLAGIEFSRHYRHNTPVDTIICTEGTEIIGAFAADDLSQRGLMDLNSGKSINIITPELNVNNQMIFRDNTQGMVYGKHVLLLVSSASTGKTILRLTDCVDYYGGRLSGISAIFSATREVNGIPVNAIFTEDDIPSYITYNPSKCELCQKKQKIDALVNSYGYSKL